MPHTAPLPLQPTALQSLATPSASDRSASVIGEVFIALVTVASAELCCVKGVVGCLEQLQCARETVLHRTGGKADRSGHAEVPGDFAVVALCQRGEHPLCDLLGDIAGRSGEDHDEFLPAVTGDEIAAAYARLQRTSAVTQDSIANLGTETIIDVLETIEVDMCDAEIAAEDDRLSELSI